MLTVTPITALWVACPYRSREPDRVLGHPHNQTDSGLTVTAYLIPENYDTGIKISEETA